jgi:hypothetical protein
MHLARRLGRALEEKMNRLVAQRKYWDAYIARGLDLMLLALLTCCVLYAPAQNISQPRNANTAFSIRATHLLGFDNAKHSCGGTLSIQDNVLYFRREGKPDAQVKVASVRGVFVGMESKQVGGLPMKLGKTAAPYGSGRVVSLFAHKKYDILTLEYVDDDGGLHGAIFQLTKGQSEVVRDELLARGVPGSSREDQPSKPSTPEVAHENK